MTANDLWNFEQCAEATGYALRSLKKYCGTGLFIKPARVVGSAYLFQPREVLAWKRRHVANRAAAGAPSPPDAKSARKSK